MKPNIYLRPVGNLSLFGAFLFLLFGASHRPQTTAAAGIIDHFKVGDVVHSVLRPTDFQRLHGTGWMLMNGSTLPINADLRLFQASLTDPNVKFTSVPDARGVFLRGMNEGRATSTGDAAGDKNIGVYQSDMVGSHSHTSVMRTYTANWVSGGPVPALEAQSPIPSQGRNPVTIGPDGGPETRPRNIALYIYIKVNE